MVNNLNEDFGEDLKYSIWVIAKFQSRDFDLSISDEWLGP